MKAVTDSVTNQTNDYFPDYDASASFDSYNYWDLIPTAIVYGLTLIAGLIGNGLIVYTVIHFRRMRTLSNVFLASLASADLLLIIVCVPVKFAQLFSYTWELGEFGCKFVHYMQNVSSICSVFTLTIMSIERYYAIIHPVKCRATFSMNYMKKIIISTWIASFILAAPVIYIQVHIEVGQRFRAFWCVRDWEKTFWWPFYECYMIWLILIVPSLIMAYTYTCICHQLWIVVQQRAGMVCGRDDFGNGSTEMRELNQTESNSEYSHNQTQRPLQQIYHNKADEDSNTVKQVIKMLVAVVVLFIICWAPILVIHVLTSFGILEPLNYGYLKPLRTAAHLLSYVNSCINPVVYGFMSKNFRASFRAAISKCLHCKGNGQSSNNRSYTSTYRINNSTTATRATSIWTQQR